MNWYLVIKNWERTDILVSHLPNIEEYQGVGGDVWPLDQSNNPASRSIHDLLMRSRQPVSLANGDSRLACCDERLAIQYFESASIELGRVRLIQASSCDFPDNTTGLDFGNPFGGYSIIESEILGSVDAPQIAAQYLDSAGLFKNVAIFNQYIADTRKPENDEALEDLDPYVLVRVTTLR
jgi:hypothetical protein